MAPGSEWREWWNPPSDKDLACLSTGDLAEVRAVTSDGTVCSIMPGPKWPESQIGVALSEARAATESAAQRIAVQRDMLDPALIWQEIALRRLARNGIIRYQRGRYGR
jgi:hypothetical protein